jgi:hypothetical protein
VEALSVLQKKPMSKKKTIRIVKKGEGTSPTDTKGQLSLSSYAPSPNGLPLYRSLNLYFVTQTVKTDSYAAFHRTLEFKLH